MFDLVRRLEFRALSYEDDPESLVDMQHCLEILEGSWFDAIDTCRMHFKIISRTPGSSWVVAFNQTVFGHADLINQQDGSGLVPRWRLHPDYRHPLVGRKLLQGLWGEAAQRRIGRLIILADRPEVSEDLEKMGLPRDRSYHRLRLDEELDRTWRRGPVADHAPAGPCLEPEDPTDFSWQPFLGLPLPLPYLVTRARMAFDYRLPFYQKADFHRLSWDGRTFAARFDGLEWYVLRRDRAAADSEAVAPILRRLLQIHPGEIRLSGKTLAAAGLPPRGDPDSWDHFTDQPV